MVVARFETKGQNADEDQQKINVAVGEGQQDKTQTR